MSAKPVTTIAGAWDRFHEHVDLPKGINDETARELFMMGAVAALTIAMRTERISVLLDEAEAICAEYLDSVSGMRMH